MAKNISLLGADYPDVPAVQLPQTGGGTATFYDITVVDNLNSSSSTDALSAKQGKVLNEKLIYRDVPMSPDFSSTGYHRGSVDIPVIDGYTPMTVAFIEVSGQDANFITANIRTNQQSIYYEAHVNYAVQSASAKARILYLKTS